MDKQFRDAVYKVVALIPQGRVMTYGQIAALCQHPLAARAVGQIAHFGPMDLPWHRVVNKRGLTARAFPWGGTLGQSRMLSNEGVKVVNNQLNLDNYLWWPK